MPSTQMRHLEGFRVAITIPVAWGEMDAFGHVNNAVYFRYFESARTAYFDEIGLEERIAPIGPILASTSARFYKPLRYPDQVRVGARTVRLGEDRFEMEYRVLSQRLEAVAAEGTGVVVTFDYDQRVKRPVPGAIADRIRELDEPLQWK